MRRVEDHLRRSCNGLNLRSDGDSLRGFGNDLRNGNGFDLRSDGDGLGRLWNYWLDFNRRRVDRFRHLKDRGVNFDAWGLNDWGLNDGRLDDWWLNDRRLNDWCLDCDRRLLNDGWGFLNDICNWLNVCCWGRNHSGRLDDNLWVDRLGLNGNWRLDDDLRSLNDWWFDDHSWSGNGVVDFRNDWWGNNNRRFDWNHNSRRHGLSDIDNGWSNNRGVDGNAVSVFQIFDEIRQSSEKPSQ